MDTNRFRKRTDYALPPKRPAPILDELGQLRQAPVVPPQAAQVIPPQSTPAPQPIAPVQQGGVRTVVKSKPVPEPPRPVYQQATAVTDEALIDLSEPSHGGWLDSIASEPLMAEAMSEGGSEAAEMTQALPAANISIQISMPKLPEFHWPTLPTLPYKRIAIWSAAVIASLAVLVGGFLIAKHMFYHPKPAVAISTGSAALASTLAKPTFVPVAPKTKPQLAEAQSRATAFDGKRDSYSYTDAFQGMPFTVSQQPLPANFSSATQAVAMVAKSIGATATLKTLGTIAYEATDTKSQSQTIVFSIDNLLIFIQSGFTHDSNTWENYIASLQAP
jgi:hypothetical protein